MSRTTWPEIYFIRHGETPWNAERRYQGRQDIPLNARGEAQALRNGEILAAELARHGRDPNSFEWHASPLQRTRETMARVRRAFAGPLPPVRFYLMWTGNSLPYMGTPFKGMMAMVCMGAWETMPCGSNDMTMLLHIRTSWHSCRGQPKGNDSSNSLRQSGEGSKKGDGTWSGP